MIMTYIIHVYILYIEQASRVCFKMYFKFWGLNWHVGLFLLKSLKWYNRRARQKSFQVFRGCLSCLFFDFFSCSFFVIAYIACWWILVNILVNVGFFGTCCCCCCFLFRVSHFRGVSHFRTPRWHLAQKAPHRGRCTNPKAQENFKNRRKFKKLRNWN